MSTKKETKKASHARSAKPTYTRLYDLGRPPTTKAAIELLAIDLLEWCSLPTSWQIHDFAIQKGFTPTRLWRLADTNDCFAHALESGKYMIATRTAEIWRKRETGDLYATKMLMLHHKDFRDMEMERSKSFQQQQQPITVLMERMPTTGRVPKRKSKE